MLSHHLKRTQSNGYQREAIDRSKEDNNYYDPLLQLTKSRKSREVSYQQIMMPTEPHARSHILRIRGIIGRKWSWRYVTDYCDKGDLRYLIDKHPSNDPTECRPIPEAFPCHVVESLAITAHDMESPPYLKPSRGEAGRSQVVHNTGRSLRHRKQRL